MPKGFAGVGPWRSWNSLIGAEGLTGDFVDFFGFFLVSVGSATAAAAAVTAFAPQAAGSGEGWGVAVNGRGLGCRICGKQRKSAVD